MPPMRAFFISGRNILFRISSGAYSSYYPQLDTPLPSHIFQTNVISKKVILKQIQNDIFCKIAYSKKEARGGHIVKRTAGAYIL